MIHNDRLSDDRQESRRSASTYSTPFQRSRLRNWIPLVATVGAFGGLYFFLRDSVSVSQIVEVLSEINPWAVVGSIAMLIGNFAVSSERYRLILRNMVDRAPTYGALFRLTFVSLFAAHLAAVGPSADLVRVAYGRFIAKLPLRKMVASVVYDRALALLASAAIGLLFLPAQAAFGLPAETLLIEGMIWVMCFVVLALVIFASSMMDKRLPLLWQYMQPIRQFIPVVFAGGSAMRQIFLAVLHPLTFGAALWLLARGMGLELSLPVALAFSPLFIVGQSIPLFLAGWGLRESVVVITLVPTGALTENQALAVSVATGIAFFIATLPGLALIFALRSHIESTAPSNQGGES